MEWMVVKTSHAVWMWWSRLLENTVEAGSGNQSGQYSRY